MTERLKSIYSGFALFVANPILGAGLGAHVNDTLRSDGAPLVIHSTPVWLLAEMGLLGFLIFTVPLLRIFRDAWTDRTPDVSGRLLIMIIVSFAVTSSVHELLYQRTFWLLFGAALAVALPSEKTLQNDSRSEA